MKKEVQKARLFITKELDDLIYVNHLSDNEITQIAKALVKYKDECLKEKKKK